MKFRKNHSEASRGVLKWSRENLVLRCTTAPAQLLLHAFSMLVTALPCVQSRVIFRNFTGHVFSTGFDIVSRYAWHSSGSASLYLCLSSNIMCVRGCVRACVCVHLYITFRNGSRFGYFRCYSRFREDVSIVRQKTEICVCISVCVCVRAYVCNVLCAIERDPGSE